jgi:hypothetical protein
MKKKFLFLLIIITYLMLLGHQIQAVECITPSEGEAFPEITLSVPQNASEMDYLGIKGKGLSKYPR